MGGGRWSCRPGCHRGLIRKWLVGLEGCRRLLARCKWRLCRDGLTSACPRKLAKWGRDAHVKLGPSRGGETSTPRPGGLHLAGSGKSQGGDVPAGRGLPHPGIGPVILPPSTLPAARLPENCKRRIKKVLELDLVGLYLNLK